MLYWAAGIAGAGLLVGLAGARGYGAGLHAISPFVCGLALGVAVLMVITHFLCVKYRWR